MFKALVLGRLHNLSDEALERQICRDLTFMSFLDLSLADAVPDAKTFWEFRQKIGAEEGFRELFEIFNEHLRRQVLHHLGGRTIDATFVEVPKQRNSREENAQIKAGQVPPDWPAQRAKLAQKDTDARWTKKGGVSHAKDHVKVDAGSKLIEDFCVSAANEHDSQSFAALVAAGDGTLWADSAYAGQACQQVLATKGVAGQICEKGNRGGPASEEQKARNRCKSKVRARAEHVFAFMTNSMGGIHLAWHCLHAIARRWPGEPWFANSAAMEQDPAPQVSPPNPLTTPVTTPACVALPASHPPSLENPPNAPAVRTPQIGCLQLRRFFNR